MNKDGWYGFGMVMAAAGLVLTGMLIVIKGASSVGNELDETKSELAEARLTLAETRYELDEANSKLYNGSIAGGNLTAAYAGEYMCTAYCTEKYSHICGTGDGITSSGQPVQAGVTVAADTRMLPYGTIIYIEGVGIRIVQDTGGAIKGNHLDVAVDTHEHALEWSGYGMHKIYVLEEVENEKGIN